MKAHLGCHSNLCFVCKWYSWKRLKGAMSLRSFCRGQAVLVNRNILSPIESISEDVRQNVLMCKCDGKYFHQNVIVIGLTAWHFLLLTHQKLCMNSSSTQRVVCILSCLKAPAMGKPVRNCNRKKITAACTMIILVFQIWPGH